MNIQTPNTLKDGAIPTGERPGSKKVYASGVRSADRGGSGPPPSWVRTRRDVRRRD